MVTLSPARNLSSPSSNPAATPNHHNPPKTNHSSKNYHFIPFSLNMRKKYILKKTYELHWLLESNTRILAQVCSKLTSRNKPGQLVMC